ncbi:MAG: class A beta-lactamase-related serine hydrolase [Pyrinomonadaceae bacterium]|nr:class A beta-lactamase-related serine hydrolase [Pyrinomonadaceae bacterium]
MKRLLNFGLCLGLLCSLSVFAAAQRTAVGPEIVPPRGYKPPVISDSPELELILDASIKAMRAKHSPVVFKAGELSATLLDLRDPQNIRRAQFNGELRLYPASVVKMYYMAALERQLEDGKVAMTPELARGLKDMIVDSSNEATQYILDVLTGTSSGAELPQKEFDLWQYKRNRVNRYFSSMGYTNINANQKTFCEDAYGIEQQSRKYKGENRNMLTTNATARLMAEIVLGRIAGPKGTEKMMELMKRDPFAATTDNDDQAHGFTGKMMIDRKMTDALLWSKAGWTSKSRHDAAFIETVDGQKFVLVVFTENHANEKGPIPTIASGVIDGLRKEK